MRRFLGAVGLLAAAVSPAAADGPADAVRKLAAPRYADREAAARELLTAGPAAAPALKAALDASTDPDLRDRAAALLSEIDRRSDSTRLTATKLVGFDYKNTPLAAAVADLKAKTGIPLTLAAGKVADPTRPITCSAATPVPAWEAVDRLCRAAGLVEEFPAEILPPADKNTSYYGRGYRGYNDGSTPQLQPGAVPVSLADGTATPPSGSRDGGVRVLVMPGRHPSNKLVRGAGRLMLTLDVTPLPSLNWAEVSAVRVTRAADEDGRPLFGDQKPNTDAAQYNPNNYWGWGWGWDDYGGGTPKALANPRLAQVAIRSDDRAIRKLTVIEGVVVGEVRLPNEPLITVNDLAAAVGKPAAAGPDEMKFAVNGVTTNKDGKTVVKLRIELLNDWVLRQMKNPNAANMQRMWWSSGEGFNNLQQTLAFTDAAGKPVPTPNSNSMSTSGDGTRNSCDVEFTFPKSDKYGPPVKVVYKGVRPVSVEVPFRAANVVLP